MGFPQPDAGLSLAEFRLPISTDATAGTRDAPTIDLVTAVVVFMPSDGRVRARPKARAGPRSESGGKEYSSQMGFKTQ